MSKEGKVLIEFNVKNGKYAIQDNLGQYTIKPLTWLNSFSKEKDLSTTDIYGDGEKVLTLVNDKGFTGVLGMTAQDLQYNEDLGFNATISNGLAEIKQRTIRTHAIYFETEFAGADGVIKTKKVWVFGVETQAPSEAYEQTTDNINNSMVDYNITIKGTNLQIPSGNTTVDATDEYGNVIKIWTLSSLPGDANYETFGDTVPVPLVEGSTTPTPSLVG